MSILIAILTFAAMLHSCKILYMRDSTKETVNYKSTILEKQGHHGSRRIRRVEPDGLSLFQPACSKHSSSWLPISAMSLNADLTS